MAGLYADFLRRWAIGRGVRRIEGQVRDISLDESGEIESLTLQSGRASKAICSSIALASARCCWDRSSACHGRTGRVVAV